MSTLTKEGKINLTASKFWRKIRVVRTTFEIGLNLLFGLITDICPM